MSSVRIFARSLAPQWIYRDFLAIEHGFKSRNTTATLAIERIFRAE